MLTGELLEKIRPTWLVRVSHDLAPIEGVREDFLTELNRFYEILKEAVSTNQLEALNDLLKSWVESQTGPEAGEDTTGLIPILNSIYLTTFDIARRTLSTREAMQVVFELLPTYTCSIELITRLETDRSVHKVSSELERAHTSLEKLDQSKSSFIAVAAHELKTPLTLIDGYTSMLRDSMNTEDHLLMMDLCLRGIDSGTHRLQEIINDMIDVSVIDNNLLSITFQPVWINRILAGVEYEVKNTLAARQLTLTIHPFQGSDQMTYGDGERLCQAFRNLVSNAIKYTPNGGSITIDGRLLPGFVEVTVKDTGIGIDPENHTTIFDKFGGLGNIAHHSSGKTKFKGGGPGLGLPITKGIIEAHGGAIWVESEACDETHCPGSTFHVLIPIRSESPDDKTAKLLRPLHEANLYK